MNCGKKKKTFQNTLSLVHFVLTIYFWVQDLPLSVVCLFSETQYNKNKLFWRASKLGMGACVDFSCHDFATSSREPWKPVCAVSPYVRQCCYVGKAVSLVSFFPLGLLIFPSTEFPKPQWRDLIKISGLGLSVDLSLSACCPVVGLCVSSHPWQ